MFSSFLLESVFLAFKLRIIRYDHYQLIQWALSIRYNHDLVVRFGRFIDRDHTVWSQSEKAEVRNGRRLLYYLSKYRIKHLLPIHIVYFMYCRYNTVYCMVFGKLDVICLSLVFGCFEFFISRVDIYVY